MFLQAEITTARFTYLMFNWMENVFLSGYSLASLSVGMYLKHFRSGFGKLSLKNKTKQKRDVGAMLNSSVLHVIG